MGDPKPFASFDDFLAQPIPTLTTPGDIRSAAKKHARAWRLMNAEPVGEATLINLRRLYLEQDESEHEFCVLLAENLAALIRSAEELNRLRPKPPA